MLIVSACGGGGTASGTPTPSITPRPSLTPTLRSTPLPTVASPVPLGVEDRPLKIALIGESSTATNRLLRDMTAYFTEETENFSLGTYDGLQVEFVLIEDRQEAITLLCNSTDTAVFVDVFTYITAKRICGAVPALQVELDDQRGSNFEVVVRTDFVATPLHLVRADSSRRVNQFCALSTTDTTFVHAALAFRALGQSEDPRFNLRNLTPKIDLFNPATLVELNTFDNARELVEATQGGGNVRQCEALVLPAGQYAEVVETIEEDEDAQPLQAVGLFDTEQLDPADQWQPIPYDVLVFPPDNLFPVYLREELLRVFNVIAEDDETQQRDLARLVEHDALVPVTAEDFAAFEAWLNKTGWNMGAPLASQ